MWIILLLGLCVDGLRVPKRQSGRTSLLGWTYSKSLHCSQLRSAAPRHDGKDTGFPDSFALCSFKAGLVDNVDSFRARHDEKDTGFPDAFDLCSFKGGFVDTVDSFLESETRGLFSYADLSDISNNEDGRGERERTCLGILFLISNVPYIIVGQMIVNSGNSIEGVLLDVAGIVSTLYHYCQLSYGPNRIEVRRSLLLDYLTASNACLIFIIDALDVAFTFRDPVNIEGSLPFLTGAMALLALWRSSIVDSDGRKYVFWHSLWHVIGAYTAFLVGTVHPTS